MAELPLVSCLCASSPKRWAQLQRAILDFTRQTYPNKELIIGVDLRTDFAGMIELFVEDALASVPPTRVHDGERIIRDLPYRIKVFGRPNSNSPMDCLIQALCHARGDIVALWDDDNLNLPSRLTDQVVRQQRHQDTLTALSECLYYFHESKELFVVNHENPEAEVSERIAISSLMSPRDALPALEPHYRTNPALHLVNGLQARNRKLLGITGKPFHHLVGVSGDNLRGYSDHRKIAQGHSRSADWINERADALVEALNQYYWDADKVNVVGADALAFEYTPKLRHSKDLYEIAIKDAEAEEVVRED